MKTWILGITLLCVGSLSAYEPFNYKKWQREYSQDLNDRFDRIEQRTQSQESNRIQRDMLREMQRQNNYRYGR